MSDIEGDVPSVPHLAFFTSASGMATAFVPGNVLAEVIDPNRADRITRLILKEVKHGKWTFKCGCSNPRCTVQVVFRAAQSGSH
jgi:hypothetical protein